MTIKQENAKIAAELGIPRIQLNREQRGYDEIHFRRCTKYLWWISALNTVLILLILFLFFTEPQENYYASSLNGDITPLQATPLANAVAITQQNQLQQPSDDS